MRIERQDKAAVLGFLGARQRRHLVLAADDHHGRDADVDQQGPAVGAVDDGALLAYEAGTRSGADPEDLHQMRVALRRMRSVLKLSGALVGDGAEPVRAELGWLGQSLGEVRDYDVLIGHLRERNITAPFHYVPLHSSDGGFRYAAKLTDCPVTNSVSGRLLRLPFHNALRREDVERVVETFIACLG